MKKIHKTALLAAGISFVACAVAFADQTSPTVHTVSGGDLAAQIIEWLEVGFGGVIGTVATALIYRALNYVGIQVTDGQKAQLQSIVVNGINAAASKAAVSLKNNSALDVNVKNAIVVDAVKYVQEHAGDTIRALGLDPKSGQAVEAIRARIATAIADPNTPTDPAITPIASGGAVTP